jgi:hypothetical protein
MLTLAPNATPVLGSPGDTVGWGFSLENTSPVDTLTVTSSYLIHETNPSLGYYSDIISYAGSPSGGLLLPGSTWTEAFSFNPDPSMQTGVGAYSIDVAAEPGMPDVATLVIEYELDNANTGMFDAAGYLTAPVEVAVGPTWMWRRNHP